MIFVKRKKALNVLRPKPFLLFAII